jgi:threonine dehydrogenase-like Zn-dependent dehydrogenase
MKAVILQKGNQFALNDLPEPELQSDTDVIVKVTTAAICGSDIHIKHGLLPGISPGTVMGHEFVGVVEKIGKSVKLHKEGSRVAAPAAVWCGICPACKRGQVQYCINGGVWGGGELFGKGLSGVQTSYVRVPYADVCLTPIPESVSDEEAVFVGDVFSTGYHAALEGNICTGDTVAVFGCGPIGLGALIASWQFGPKKIFCVDMLPNRLEIAEQFGAKAINARLGNASQQIIEQNGNEGVDVVIEAVGNQDILLEACSSVRRGGSVSVVGIFPGPVELPLQNLVPYGLRISMGLGNLGHMSRLMGLIESGRVNLSPLVTHTFALDDALEAYDLFENHKDQCIKVLLKP